MYSTCLSIILATALHPREETINISSDLMLSVVDMQNYTLTATFFVSQIFVSHEHRSIIFNPRLFVLGEGEKSTIMMLI